MSDKARPNDVAIARNALIQNVRVRKKDVMDMLEGGERDWSRVRTALNEYIDFQTAADVLGGTSTMEKT